MNIILISVIVSIFSIGLCLNIDQNYIINDATRTIYTNSHIVHHKIEYSITRIKPGNMFFVVIPEVQAKNMSLITGQHNSKNLEIIYSKDK